MKSKPVYKSTTVFGLIVLAIVGLLAVFDIRVTDSELEQVGQALGVLIGFAVGLYGRIKARVALGFKSPHILPFLGVLIAIPAMSLQTGCQQWESLPESGKQAVKAGAKLALLIGVNELATRVPEVAPYRPIIESSIHLTFEAAGTDPEPGLLGRALASAVRANVPEQYHELILSALSLSLVPETEDGTTASDPDAAKFNTALAAAIK